MFATPVIAKTLVLVLIDNFKPESADGSIPSLLSGPIRLEIEN